MICESIFTLLGLLASVVSILITVELVFGVLPADVENIKQSNATIPTQPIQAPEPKEFTIAATGDLLIHGRVRNKAQVEGGWDFRPMFRFVKPLLQEADIAVCHVETPFSIDNTRLSGYPSFNIPNQMADAIADAGYDTCSLASNHATDTGEHGIEGTISALNRVGVRHTGMARSAEEAEKLNILEVEGFKIAFFSYTYGLNHGPLRAGFEYQTNMIDEERILKDTKRAKDVGVDFIVVSLHWGDEYRTTPSTYQTEVAEALMASEEIDLIVGHHAHVVQPIGQFGDRYVAFGLGNFLSAQYPAGCNCPINVRDGVIVYFTVRENYEGRLVVKKIEYIPTYVLWEDHTIIPAVPSTDTVLEKSTERTKEILGRMGVKVSIYGSEEIEASSDGGDGEASDGQCEQ